MKAITIPEVFKIISLLALFALALYSLYLVILHQHNVKRARYRQIFDLQAETINMEIETLYHNKENADRIKELFNNIEQNFMKDYTKIRLLRAKFADRWGDLEEYMPDDKQVNTKRFSKFENYSDVTEDDRTFLRRMRADIETTFVSDQPPVIKEKK